MISRQPHVYVVREETPVGGVYVDRITGAVWYRKHANFVRVWNEVLIEQYTKRAESAYNDQFGAF